MRIIRSVQQTTDYSTLKLSNRGLHVLPYEVGLLDRLVKLHLSNNQLSTFPVFLGQLQKLETLDLSQNRLMSISYHLAVSLPFLKKLQVRTSCAFILPPSVAKLTTHTHTHHRTRTRPRTARVADPSVATQPNRHCVAFPDVRSREPHRARLVPQQIGLSPFIPTTHDTRIPNTPHTAHRTPHTAHRTPHTAHRTPHTAHRTRTPHTHTAHAHRTHRALHHTRLACKENE
jgi:hypothetical protein